jgi:hypothetical protein
MTESNNADLVDNIVELNKAVTDLLAILADLEEILRKIERKL